MTRITPSAVAKQPATDARHDPRNARWLRLLARAYTLQVARLLPGVGPVTLDLPAFGRVTVPRTDEPGLLSVHQYTDACHAALALGDEEALAILGGIPPERLERMKEADLPHLLLEARSMRHYALGEMRPSAVLALETVQACNSPLLTGGERAFAQMVVFENRRLSLTGIRRAALNPSRPGTARSVSG